MDRADLFVRLPVTSISGQSDRLDRIDDMGVFCHGSCRPTDDGAAGGGPAFCRCGPPLYA